MKIRTYLIIDEDFEPIKYVEIESNINRPNNPDDDDLMQDHMLSHGMDLGTHKYIRVDYIYTDAIKKNYCTEEGWNC